MKICKIIVRLSGSGFGIREIFYNVIKQNPLSYNAVNIGDINNQVLIKKNSINKIDSGKIRDDLNDFQVFYINILSESEFSENDIKIASRKLVDKHIESVNKKYNEILLLKIHTDEIQKLIEGK